MKKLVSLLIAILVIAGAVGTFPASSAYAASNADEVEVAPLLIVEANAKEISYMEMTEAIENAEEETVEVSECPELSEVSECYDDTESQEIPEDLEEETEAVSEEVDSDSFDVNVVMYDIGSYVDSVDYEAVYFSVDEVFFQVWEMDADAKAVVVQYGDEYYFIVEWNVLDSNGFVKLTKEECEGEEFFICGGDEFRTMIIRSFVAGESMFEA